MMYVICDKETGNFLSPYSFQFDERQNIWVYTTYTGLLGTRFYNTKEETKRALDILQKYNIESGGSKKLYITEINVDKLPVGEIKHKYIIEMNKYIDLAI